MSSFSRVVKSSNTLGFWKKTAKWYQEHDQQIPAFIMQAYMKASADFAIQGQRWKNETIALHKQYQRDIVEPWNYLKTLSCDICRRKKLHWINFNKGEVACSCGAEYIVTDEGDLELTG